MSDPVSSPATNALSQLRDIHLPTAIGWWPPAIGWYFLILSLMTLISVSLFFIHRYYVSIRPRREALRLLASYEAAYQKGREHQITAAFISELLKRVALVYFPRKEVASLQGKEWLDFLNQTSHDFDFNTVRDQLLVAPYQAEVNTDLQPLFIIAKKWIKQRLSVLKLRKNPNSNLHTSKKTK